jgi:hypothetical protein
MMRAATYPSASVSAQPPGNRIEDERGSDLSDDQAELEDRGQLQAGGRGIPGDEVRVGPARTHSVNEEKPSRDARYECADEQPAEDPTTSPKIHVFHPRAVPQTDPDGS